MPAGTDRQNGIFTDPNAVSKFVEDIEGGLKRLGLDYVDIWHLHSRDTPDTITDEAVEACEILKKQGMGD